MSHKRETCSLNANAPEFIPFAVQQSQQSQQHVAQRVNPGQISLSPSERVTEVIREAYGYVTGTTAATNPPRRPSASQGRPALSGICGESVGPMNARLDHSITRAKQLHNPSVSNLPIDTRPGSTKYQVAGYSHQQNGFTPSSAPDNLDAASARLLSVRYGFVPNHPTLRAAQPRITGHGDSGIPRPLARRTPYHLAGSSTGMRFRPLNQHVAFDITRATGPRNPAVEVSTTPTCSTQDPSNDGNGYGDRPGDAIWVKRSYIDPEMPKRCSLDDKMAYDKNGNEIQWEEKPTPPPFPYQKRFLPHKPSTYGRVPLHGVLGGMQYDHNTKLYYGDGLPRRTPFRPDGTGPCTPDQARDTHSGSDNVNTRKLPSDTLHLQPMWEVREILSDFGVHGMATMRFCRCIHMWGPESAMTGHVCTEPSIENRVQATPVSIKKARSEDWISGLEPVPHHGERESIQAEKKMRGTNNVDVAMAAGDGDRTGTEVRDFSEFFADGRGEKMLPMPIIRDFGAGNKG